MVNSLMVRLYINYPLGNQLRRKFSFTCRFVISPNYHAFSATTAPLI
jgi:hypothetical protein